MITLTNKETILCQELITSTNEINQVVLSKKFFDKEIIKKLNMTFNQLKGVYSSIAMKGLLNYDGDVNGMYEVYEWSVSVRNEDGTFNINTVEELLKVAQ